jgi:hypothetical protein
MLKRNTSKMGLKSKLTVVIWVVFCVVVSSAQDQKSSLQSRPDLTGTWVRISYKSSRGPLSSNPVTLTISHNEPEIKITRKSVVQGKERIVDEVYYTDGRGEKNKWHVRSAIVLGPTPTSGIEQKGSKNAEARKSKTKWEGNKLVTRSSSSFEVMGHRVDVDMTQKRELSADGKKLTIVMSSSPGAPAITEVYDRVP